MAQERLKRFRRGIYHPRRKSPLNAAESVQKAIIYLEHDPEWAYARNFLYLEASFFCVCASSSDAWALKAAR